MTPTGQHWYAIETRPRWERTVYAQLEHKGYHPFLPLYLCSRRWSDRIKEIELPLFSGYIFCRLDLKERFLPLLTTSGVRRLVGIGKTPAAIPDHEVAAVQALVKSGLPAQPWPFMNIGQRVRINFGAMEGLEGVLVASRKNCRLVISVETLHRSVGVEVSSAWVEPIRRPLHTAAAA